MKPRKINWKSQPHGSQLCGQTCVAMIAKVSLKAAIEACGRGLKGTRARDVLKAFRLLGVEIKGTRLVPVTRNPPRRCLQKMCFIHYSSGRTLNHWRIRWDGQIYDPDFGISFLEGGKPSEAYWSRVISYIEL